MSKTMRYVIAALGFLLIIVLAAVFIIVLRDVVGNGGGAQPTVAATAVAQLPTATPGELPPPAIEVPPTFTPLPTSTPTDTPVPTTPTATNTPLPTNTLPPPTATNTPVPVIIPTKPPPPTNTPAPTAPPAPDTRGLVATNFAIQPRSNFGVNQQVWFEFSIVNTTGGNVPYYRLGALPRKDGTDRSAWFQQSYGGPSASIKPSGLDHEDNIKLPEAGNYTLRLVICFDSWEACNSGSPNWVTMSQEIPIQIK